MRTKFLPLLVLPLAMSACSASEVADAPAPIAEKQAKQMAKELDGKIPGEPVSCITTTNARDAIRISDDTLLYRVSGNLVYLNKLRSTCPGLARRDDIMVVETYSGQYCRGDFIRQVDRFSGIQGPSCSFGDFIPYRKAK